VGRANLALAPSLCRIELCPSIASIGERRANLALAPSLCGIELCPSILSIGGARAARLLPGGVDSWAADDPGVSIGTLRRG
jgi:hypothetical protein